MGWEFNSHDFITFYNDNGIKRQLFALYTPYYNRVCERKNVTTLDMVRRFFNKSSLQKTLYPEFVVWSTYVLNWSPSSVLTRTPKEDWSGIKLIVHYFKVFGYIGYTHMTYHKRTKLDDKGEKCILLGISDKSKGYKLYDLITKKLLISKDVVFANMNFGLRIH